MQQKNNADLKKAIDNAGVNIHNGLVTVSHSLILIAIMIMFHGCMTS